MAGDSGFKLEFSDLIAPLPVEQFLDEYWGRKLHATALCEDMLTILSVGFHDGDLAECASCCRKDDNSRFTDEEIQGLQGDLDQRRSVILPFCFTPGAIDMKRAFIDACSGFGNDIEVGMYFSRPGCEPAQWHFDPNHNVTIQLLGEKDWFYAPGDPHTLGGARGLRDAPMNFLDQSVDIPRTGPLDRSCYNLRPGSVLYLPPGHWHSVVPVKSECVSVNLRVANIAHAKWICEAVFARLMQTARNHQAFQLVGPGDLGPGQLSATAQQQVTLLSSELETALGVCRMPRCFPFQPEHSDGLRLGATLSFLHDQGFVAEQRLLEGTVGVNPLVSILPKLRDADQLVLDLRSVSSLTGSDYLRFSLLCSASLYDAMKRLAVKGKASIEELRQLCPGCQDDRQQKAAERQSLQKKRKKDVRADASAAGDHELVLLLCVLLHGNVLYVERGGAQTQAEDAPPGQKRKKLRAPSD